MSDSDRYAHLSPEFDGAAHGSRRERWQIDMRLKDLNAGIDVPHSVARANAFYREIEEDYDDAANPGTTEQGRAARVDGVVLRRAQNPWQIACGWYSVTEIAHNIQRQRTIVDSLERKMPTDVYSREFAEWLTDQYRLAMAKGIQLGRGEE